MAFRTAVVIVSFLIGLGALARESFAQDYPPQTYPPPRDYPLAGYQPLPPVDPDDDAALPPRYYDLPAAGSSHIGAAGPGQVDPLAPGLMRGDPRTIAALPPEVRPETGPKKELPPQFRRTLAAYYTKEPAGTIVIDTPNTYLYLVLGNGKALRYGIGVGRDGFTWSGSERISRLAEWPDWNPPEQMIERQPYLPRFMAGGEGNPLGARALYLGDTLYRIHGTNQPSTIGTFVSSGCIRLTNEDIMDLYKRVKVGTRVVVLPSGPPMTAAVRSRRGMSEVAPYGLPSASDMPRKRYKPEEITAKLQQVDVLVAQGRTIADAARQVGITESRYYRWREERGALKRDELKNPKELAHEGPKGLAQGEVSAVRDNAQREFKAEPAGFEE
jgi:lipoprotein-anchoring transpeptidase ErfK/SrfK/transposase-like protein